jgi:Polyketide cyclase / dehydrase and lipid transport
MATLRETIHIDATPDVVWAGVRDPLALLDWFDGIDGGEMVGTARKLKMGDISVTEEIVTVDDDLRRFQYSITEMPIPVEHHLSTIDVLPDGDGTLIVYGVDVRPDMLKDILGPTISGATKGMKKHFEST